MNGSKNCLPAEAPQPPPARSASVQSRGRRTLDARTGGYHSDASAEEVSRPGSPSTRRPGRAGSRSRMPDRGVQMNARLVLRCHLDDQLDPRLRVRAVVQTDL